MLRCFVRANKNYRHVQSIALLQRRIAIDVDFAERGPQFPQQGRNRRLGLLAQVATGPRIQRHFAWGAVSQVLLLTRFAHGFGLEYF